MKLKLFPTIAEQLPRQGLTPQPRAPPRPQNQAPMFGECPCEGEKRATTYSWRQWLAGFWRR